MPLTITELQGYTPYYDGQNGVRRKEVHSSSLSSLRKSWLSTSFHKDVDDPERPYARYYSFRRTRDKLIVRHSYQWLLSIILAGAIAAALYGYERYLTISTPSKHIFNSIITGLSIALGINIASSLKSYAEMMRWRLLTISWMTLREFDLILHCGSLHKVLELIFQVATRKFPFVTKRAAKIHLIAFGWIFLNIAAQVLVAMIGLTYSLDTSAYDTTQPGIVSIVNLATITDPWTPQLKSNESQMFAAHTFGIQGQDATLITYTTADFDDVVVDCWHTVYTNESRSVSFTRFADINPGDSTKSPIGQAQLCSDRIIVVNAWCEAYNVINLGGSAADGYTAYYKTGESDETQTLYIREAVPGGMTWMGDTTSAEERCGSRRCAHVVGFQMAQDSSDPNAQLSIPSSTIFDCLNEPTKVLNLPAQYEEYDLHDEEAFFLAGAIGWMGFSIPGVSGGSMDRSSQYVVYPPDTFWAFNEVPPANGPGSAAALIQDFTAGALTAMDSNAGRVNITSDRQPQRASKVDVEWHWTIPLLAGIVALHFLAMVLVILWANKAVIIDDSFLSIAKLLGPTVGKLGEQGSVLRGEEIAAALTNRAGGHYKIFYGCRDLSADNDNSDVESNRLSRQDSIYGRGILRAGIFEQADGIKPKKERQFVDGTYD